MTALDQAFIKAFSQQGAPGAAMPSRRGCSGRETVAARFSETFDGVLAALEKPPGRPASLSKAEGGPAESDGQGGPGSGVRGWAEEHDNAPGLRSGGKATRDRAVCRPLKSAANSGQRHEQWAVDSGQWARGQRAVGRRQCSAVDRAVHRRRGDTSRPTITGSGPRTIGSRLPSTIANRPSTINHPRRSSSPRGRWNDSPGRGFVGG